MTEPAAAFAAIVRRSAEALATTVEPLERGCAVRCNGLDDVWSLNSLYLDEPTSAAAIVEAAQRTQGDLGYRHAHLVGELRDGDERELASGGWSLGDDAVCALRADAGHDGPEVDDLDVDELCALMDAWTLEGDEGASDRRRAAILEFCVREGRWWSERRCGARDAAGAAVGVARLRVDGEVAWIEDVYVALDARARGHGTRAVASAVRAAREAGCTTVVLAAERDSVALRLYESIGFEVVGSRCVAHLDGTA